ncbi:hypothetical protein [Rivularia sp. UHCC 0363]|nr:hypothetical protein [Rivularia sp. UHCC 0363]MEA5595771.1 hypothetical protein [Rivularia sp. UHCC 0363]
MPKIPKCDGRFANRRRHRCRFYSGNPYVVCAVLPDGSDGRE